MKAVVLAGGFAKRMWPLTKDRPKHLLPIAGRPMLDYVMEKLEPVPGLDRIYILTNAKFEDKFRDYLNKKTRMKDTPLFVEDTRSEEEKLGSVGALGYLVEEERIDDELLVIGGDNIFGFKMTDLTDYFQSKHANVVALCDVKSKSKARLYEVVSIDNENKIIDFLEKPSQPQSTLISTACYVFTRNGVQNIVRYLDKGNDPDKAGHFIKWLHRNDEVYGFIFEDIWFDIGSFESYNEANEYFTRMQSFNLCA
jgi:glucose-1-phosphate thymidylyltransferase